MQIQEIEDLEKKVQRQKDAIQRRVIFQEMKDGKTPLSQKTRYLVSGYEALKASDYIRAIDLFCEFIEYPFDLPGEDGLSFEEVLKHRRVFRKAAIRGLEIAIKKYLKKPSSMGYEGIKEIERGLAILKKYAKKEETKQ